MRGSETGASAGAPSAPASGKQKFTPGPWRVADSGIVHADRRDSGLYQPVADLFITNDVPKMQREANAHLIAAAPDLFEQLERALAVIEKSSIIWMGDDTAHAALRKALGGAE